MESRRSHRPVNLGRNEDPPSTSTGGRMDTLDLSDIISKKVTNLHVGQFSTWLEFEGGAELHVEPKITNTNCEKGSAYATLVVRVA